jgi:plasmid stability protein
MATLTIRDLDDALKQRLRIRAAHRNQSMEEEARQILKAALLAPSTPDADLAQRIRARFTAFGDVTLPPVEREPVRPPPDFGAGRAPARRPAVKSGRKVGRR